jgi:hypothetical protein
MVQSSAGGGTVLEPFLMCQKKNSTLAPTARSSPTRVVLRDLRVALEAVENRLAILLLKFLTTRFAANLPDFHLTSTRRARSMMAGSCQNG